MFFRGGGVVCTGKPTAAMRRMVHPPFNSYSSFINPPPDICLMHLRPESRQGCSPPAGGQFQVGVFAQFRVGANTESVQG